MYYFITFTGRYLVMSVTNVKQMVESRGETAIYTDGYYGSTTFLDNHLHLKKVFVLQWYKFCPIKITES